MKYLMPSVHSYAYQIRTYCPKCGNRLSAQLHSTGTFHERTGDEVYELKLVCPLKRHWFDFHTSKWEEDVFVPINGDPFSERVKFDASGDLL